MIRTRKVRRAVKRTDLNSTLGESRRRSSEKLRGSEGADNIAARARARRSEGVSPPALVSKAMPLEMVGDVGQRPAAEATSSVEGRVEEEQKQESSRLRGGGLPFCVDFPFWHEI